jgi:hypothetical protein
MTLEMDAVGYNKTISEINSLEPAFFKTYVTYL